MHHYLLLLLRRSILFSQAPPPPLRQQLHRRSCQIPLIPVRLRLATSRFRTFTTTSQDSALTARLPLPVVVWTRPRRIRLLCSSPTLTATSSVRRVKGAASTAASSGRARPVRRRQPRRTDGRRPPSGRDDACARSTRRSRPLGRGPALGT